MLFYLHLYCVLRVAQRNKSTTSLVFVHGREERVDEVTKNERERERHWS